MYNDKNRFQGLLLFRQYCFACGFRCSVVRTNLVRSLAHGNMRKLIFW